MFPALLIEHARARRSHQGAGRWRSAARCSLAVLLMPRSASRCGPLLERRLGTDGPAFTSLFQGATRWQTFVALAVAGNLYGDSGWRSPRSPWSR